MMKVQTAIRSCIQKQLGASERELHMCSLLTLHTKIPEVESIVSDLQLQQNFLFILLMAVYCSIMIVNTVVDIIFTEPNYYVVSIFVLVVNLVMFICFMVLWIYNVKAIQKYFSFIFCFTHCNLVWFAVFSLEMVMEMSQETFQQLDYLPTVMIISCLGLNSQFYVLIINILTITIVRIIFLIKVSQLDDVQSFIAIRHKICESLVSGIALLIFVYRSQLMTIMMVRKSYLAKKQATQLSNILKSNSDGILITSSNQTDLNENQSDSKAQDPQLCQNISQNRPDQHMYLKNFTFDVQLCNEAFSTFTGIQLKEKHNFHKEKLENRSDLYEERSNHTDTHIIEGVKFDEQLRKKQFQYVKEKNTNIEAGIPQLLDEQSFTQFKEDGISLLQILQKQQEFEGSGQKLQIKPPNDDKTYQLKITRHALLFNEQLCSIFLFQDITHVNKLEEQRLQNQALRIFTASISHEVTIPIACILNFAQECIDLCQDNPIIQNNLRLICQTIKILKCHFKMLMDHSMIEANCLEPFYVPCNVQELIEETRQLMSSLCDAKNLKIVCYTDIVLNDLVIIDEQRIQQVLINLITNAIKFTVEEDTIRIVAKSLPGNLIEISVKDNGIGISKSDQTNLFKPFFRSSDQQKRQMNPNGHGLGLYISLQICKALGGNLIANSQLNQGSIFIMTVLCKPQKNFSMDVSQKQDCSQMQVRQNPKKKTLRDKSRDNNINIQPSHSSEGTVQSKIFDTSLQNQYESSRKKQYGDSNKDLLLSEDYKDLHDEIEKRFSNRNSNEQIFVNELSDKSFMQHRYGGISKSSGDSLSSKKSQNSLIQVLYPQEDISPVSKKKMDTSSFENIDFSKRQQKSKIIVADDQKLVIESFRSVFDKLGLIELTQFFTNGQDVIDAVKKITTSQLEGAKSFPICPVRILLLDFQMPAKNGLQVVQELKEFFYNLICEKDQLLTAELFIMQPKYVFITGHLYNKQFIELAQSKGVDYFFEKPLTIDAQKKLLQLINPEKPQVQQISET